MEVTRLIILYFSEWQDSEWHFPSICFDLYLWEEHTLLWEKTLFRVFTLPLPPGRAEPRPVCNAPHDQGGLWSLCGCHVFWGHRPWEFVSSSTSPCLLWTQSPERDGHAEAGPQGARWLRLPMRPCPDRSLTGSKGRGPSQRHERTAGDSHGCEPKGGC